MTVARNAIEPDGALARAVRLTQEHRNAHGERDAAIVAAVRSGHSPERVARACGLAKRTVQLIVGKADEAGR